MQGWAKNCVALPLSFLVCFPSLPAIVIIETKNELFRLTRPRRPVVAIPFHDTLFAISSPSFSDIPYNIHLFWFSMPCFFRNQSRPSHMPWTLRTSPQSNVPLNDAGETDHHHNKSYFSSSTFFSPTDATTPLRVSNACIRGARRHFVYLVSSFRRTIVQPTVRFTRGACAVVGHGCVCPFICLSFSLSAVLVEAAGVLPGLVRLCETPRRMPLLLLPGSFIHRVAGPQRPADSALAPWVLENAASRGLMLRK